MDNLPLPTQLLPCLAIPFVELFPNLCLGWWTPPSLNLKQYNKLWYLRVSLMSIAMFPVFELLLPIIDDGPNLSLLVIGFVFCVVSRNFLMRKQIDCLFNTPMWSTNLPPDKRLALFIIISNAKPSNVEKFDQIAARYVTLPTKIAGMVMYGVLTALHPHLNEDDKMNAMGACGLFIVGGIGISGTRHANLALDCLFRCVFFAGFTAMLFFVSEVSDAVFIKSIR